MEGPYATIEYGDEKIPLSEEDFWKLAAGHRLENMEKELFKHISKEIKQNLKDRKKGAISHLSKLSDPAWKAFITQKFNPDNKLGVMIPNQKGVTYIKNKEDVREES